ncbi:S-type pyocin domain-containing protein [Pseudomonas protegens]|uniref:S-type pyocin domain-containing protein n=1 Tax=Pseudomonas protegens TaxID=380021 RepID=UPI000AC0E534|nr:S-type pyocin domain-containing protein [Pseudomonas protegens]
MSNTNDYLGPGASQTGPGSYVLPATTIYGTSAGVSAMGDSFRITAGPNTTKYDPHREAMLTNRAEYKEFYTELSRIEKEVKEKYEDILSKTDKYVQDELQASGVSSTQSKLSAEKLQRDTKVLEGLINRRESDRQILIEQSKAYSGSDPLSLSIEKRNSYAILGAPRYRPTVKAQIQKNYGESYTAAYQAKWLEVLIKNLKSELYLRQIQIPEAQAEAARVSNTFHMQGSVAVAQPLFTAVRGTLAIEGGAAALATAIRSAIAGLAGLVAGAASSAAVGVIAFLAFPRELGNGELPERYSFSTPLSDLAPNLSSQALQTAAAVDGTVDLPVRISSKTAEDGRSKVFVVKTDGVTVPSKVRVVTASYNAGQNVYTATTTDVPSRTLTWTPVVSPGNSSTSLPAETAPPTVYNGATITPVEGRIDTFPEVTDASFDDYILILPVGTGFVPLYLMFHSPYGETNAKGQYSGRDYNTNKAGGPVLDLDWRTATIDQAGVNQVKLHTSRFGESPDNKVMIDRLERILKGVLQVTDIDKRFYTHEIRELERYRNLGVKDGEIPENRTEVWNNTHTATLEDYKINEKTQPLYTPEAEEAYFK